MSNIYENFTTEKEEKIVRMGRNLITLCEKNELYPKDDEMWNAAVTAGNRLVTINTTYGMKSLRELKTNEAKAVSHYLDKYGLDHEAILMV
tara:strand:+ start:393 stop:665 length:273 start_codon:yes stop_codon:yes gene_type:complete